jgi:hypothetical protein
MVAKVLMVEVHFLEKIQVKLTVLLLMLLATLQKI